MPSFEPDSPSLRRAVSILALIGVSFYLIVVAILYSEQRTMLFAGAGAACTDMPTTPEGYRPLHLTTADALRLKAWYRAALPGRSTFLFFHGNADSAGSGEALLASAVADGRGALLVEYRGYCGNPGSPDEQGFYRDGDAASRWLRERGIEPTKVVIVGYSLGSGVAAKIAMDNRPAGLVLISAYASMAEVAAEHFPWAPAKWLVRDRFPTVDRVARVKAPILIIHGSEDQTVDPRNAVALSRARPDATLVMVPGEGHLVGSRDQAPRILAEWLQTHRL